MIFKDKVIANFSSPKFIIGICLLIILLMLLYLSSVECYLEPELVAEVKLDPTYFPSGNVHEGWHAVYEAYGKYPGTWVHPHEYYQSRSIDEWPEMDLENYTYIITYCHRIESLSYKAWEENNVPVPTGAKEGHMTLRQDVEPLTVFIYRIPKMRINNPEI